MPSEFHFVEPVDRPIDPSVNDSHEDIPLVVRAFWPVVYGLVLLVLLLMVLIDVAHGGGPRYVAGITYFDSGTKGTPLTWAQGSLAYYSDQNDLSALLPHASADAFVADAFSRWTTISTAAISVRLAGQLSEDVNGSNVFVNADRSITVPPDILPGAIDKPVAIIYDNGGAVTDALLGLGASDPFYCFTNAVLGDADNLSTDGHIVHAMVVLNGNCAQNPSQLADTKYQLVRVLGRVLGLAWSQANLNVITRMPVPTPEDYGGFTIMHAQDPISCVPIAACYANADQPKMDDRAALSRLYPVTTGNISDFSGKQLFFENTGRIHGSVRFVDATGAAAQPMQGANVVARLVDPVSGKVSGTSVATSVSGFLFHAKDGNPVTGPDDYASGGRFDQLGSDDPVLEGSFDLAGLEIPNGASSAKYQLTTEALDPAWSQRVDPYGPWQVQPSGSVQPTIVTVSKGGESQQDLLMLGSAPQQPESFGPEDYANPAPVPSAGDWTGSLAGYGDADYFWFYGHANRTLAVEVTAVDAVGVASEVKAQPVIGMWGLSDPPGNSAPANSRSAFNWTSFGMTHLDATLLGTSGFRIGIADYRGDGRPDYRYHARVLYGDTVTPDRAGVRGGNGLAIDGLGFTTKLTVSIGGVSVPVLSRSSNQMIVTAPARADGVQTVDISDAITGSVITMTDAVTYGAGPSDVIRLISGGNPPTAIGAEAKDPIRIAAYRADNSSPVAGASVLLSAAPPAAFSACGGAASCTLFGDDGGQVITRVTPLTAGITTITAALAPASYNPPKTVQTTLLGTSSALDLGAVSPNQFIAEGATLDVPLSTRVLSNGVPLSGRTVNFQIVSGSGTLSAPNANSDTKGYANTSVHLVTLAADVQISACVEPGDRPCQTFYLTAVPVSSLVLEAVTGASQIVPSGQNFQPVTFRVTTSAVPGDAVRGANVGFYVLIERPCKDDPVIWLGEGIIGKQPAPVILGSTQSSSSSDANGIVSLAPSTAAFIGPLVLQGTVSVGTSTASFALQSLVVMQNGLRDGEVTVHGGPQ
jgi:hypothetical protein